MKIVAVLFAIVAMSGCHPVGPDAGQQAVLIQKPWFFGHGGVVEDPVKTGLTFVAWSTSSVYVSMQPQRVEVDLPDTMTSDGVPISFHAVLAYQVTDSVKLVRDFGDAWYQNNLAQPFSTAVRQSVRKHGMNETAISTTAIDAIDQEIREGLVASIASQGLPVKLITLTVGRANPPDSVKNQRVEKALARSSRTARRRSTTSASSA